jgi:hypothetical protein
MLRAGAIRRKLDTMRDMQRGRLALRASLLALAATLAGCSASEIVQNLPSPTIAPDLSQPNYRRIVAANIKSLFPDQSLLGDVEISGVRMVDHLKGAAWLTCLKLDARGAPNYYAIFMQGDNIIDSRAGVVMDQCHKEAYAPFESFPTARKPETVSIIPGSDAGSAGTR